MTTSQERSQSFELVNTPTMDDRRSLLPQRPPYESLDHDDENYGRQQEDEDDGSGMSDLEDIQTQFSWVEYFIFMLLGIAMLWAWNMFLAAAPYFHRRCEDNNWIVDHFQPAEVSVSTVTNFCGVLLLSNLQKNASYPRRILLALLICCVTFLLLALSTLFKTTAGVYFGFLLAMVFASSVSTALIQNGLFAYAASFAQSQYTQAIMTGQGIAGVLPPLVQILTVATLPGGGGDADEISQSPRSAFAYFLTAVGIAAISLLAYVYLLRRGAQSGASKVVRDVAVEDVDEGDFQGGSVLSLNSRKSSVSLWLLFSKLRLLSLAVFLSFAVTMVFPVFTASILSVSNIDAAIFIPTAFLMWNLGDLTGRLVTILPSLSLVHYPFALFSMSLARLVFIPLYFLCNIKGKGAIVNSDLYYLVIVQFLFGLTGGYLGSQCMMGAGDWVLPDEREAAGAFMGLMLVGGLTLGSLLSFSLGGI